MKKFFAANLLHKTCIWKLSISYLGLWETYSVLYHMNANNFAKKKSLNMPGVGLTWKIFSRLKLDEKAPGKVQPDQNKLYETLVPRQLAINLLILIGQ